MLVRELIEKLQEMDQEAVVNIYDGYDCHLGDQWSVCSSVVEEPVKWDENLECSVVEVFIQ